jgi:hypothetical protein
MRIHSRGEMPRMLNENQGLKFFKAMSVDTVFWVVTLCNDTVGYHCFGGPCCLYLHYEGGGKFGSRPARNTSRQDNWSNRFQHVHWSKFWNTTRCPIMDRWKTWNLKAKRTNLWPNITTDSLLLWLITVSCLKPMIWLTFTTKKKKKKTTTTTVETLIKAVRTIL